MSPVYCSYSPWLATALCLMVLQHRHIRCCCLLGSTWWFCSCSGSSYSGPTLGKHTLHSNYGMRVDCTNCGQMWPILKLQASKWFTSHFSNLIHVTEDGSRTNQRYTLIQCCLVSDQDRVLWLLHGWCQQLCFPLGFHYNSEIISTYTVFRHPNQLLFLLLSQIFKAVGGSYHLSNISCLWVLHCPHQSTQIQIKWNAVVNLMLRGCQRSKNKSSKVVFNS